MHDKAVNTSYAKTEALAERRNVRKRGFPFGDWLLSGWSALIFLYLFAPLLVVVLFSFNDSAISAFPLHGFTWQWYNELVSDGALQSSFGNSVLVAVVVVIASTALGVLAAVGITRYTVRLRAALNALIMLPMMAPRLILGIALLSTFSFFHVRLSLFTVIVGHIVVALPYVVLIVSARLVGFDRNLEEAAMDLGASRWAVFREITLPLLWPAIIGGALISFTLSFDEVVVAFFTIGNQNTLPISIWSMLRFGITPLINALATVTLIVSVGVAIAAEFFIRKSAV